MAKPDEFMLFLVGGLVIMAILFVAFGAYFVPSEQAASFSGFGSPIFVGTANYENVDTLYASFDANNFAQTNAFNMGSRQIVNGLLFGSTSVNLDVGNAQSVFMSFDVESTNGYGPVIIKLDGNIVYQERLDAGHYEFSFGQGKKVAIEAGSSEWRIWAPSLYVLNNVGIGATVYPREISTYIFELNDPEKVQAARIDFNLRDNAGSLIMKLNGDVIYDGVLNPTQSIYVDQSKLNKLNIITFDAREDSKFAGRATIALTSVTEQDKSLQATINLTQDEYNKFRTGTLAFSIVDVFRPGGYTIKIVNGNSVLLNEYVKLEKGYFEFTLKKENLKPGLNTVIITSLDNAAFNVQGLITRL